MGSIRASRPRFRREGDVPRVELTPDDAEILRHVYRHRFVRAEDLYRLFPDRSEDRLSRRLTLLFRAGYLDRPIAQIDRYHQGGSQSLVYGLDSAGAQHLKERLGISVGGADWKSRNRSYTRQNLEHTLAVAKFMIDLEVACRTRSDLSLIRFEDLLQAAPETTLQSKNPMCWPVPVQWHGGRAIVHLAPDAIFGMRTQAPNGKAQRGHFFLELDRGTMTIVPSEQARETEAFPYRATVLRKLFAYADSYRLGLHTERFGIQVPRVLILTPSAARATATRRAAAEFIIKSMRLPAGMFLFSDATVSSDVLGASYKDALGQVVSLVPLR